MWPLLPPVTWGGVERLSCVPITPGSTVPFPTNKGMPGMQGVANRDIKLENTLLEGSPRPLIKICDFGYSKVQWPPLCMSMKEVQTAARGALGALSYNRLLEG